MSLPSVTSEYNYNSLIVALSAGGAFFVLFVGIIAILLQRQRSNSTADRHTTLLVKRTPEKPLTLKKPTAVRSPGQVVGAGVLLKKTPSPTGSKSPPGTCTLVDPRRLSVDSSRRSSAESSKKNSPDVEAAAEAVEETETPSPKDEAAKVCGPSPVACLSLV